jgi:hypothetical protein
VLAHVAGIPIEEALLAAPALLAGMAMIAGSIRATIGRVPSDARVIDVAEDPRRGNGREAQGAGARGRSSDR